jgi:hypothetical protein
VFNGHVQRILAASAAAILGPWSCAMAASAQITELGATQSSIVAPTCPTNLPPSQCTIILTRATALETVRDGVDYPTKVTTLANHRARSAPLI